MSSRCRTVQATLLAIGMLLATERLPAAESWPAALARMPLPRQVDELNRTNCVDLLLRAFQSNAVVKALIFMPGATDEFYMFRRARAALTNVSPSLLDAVVALTNQTLIRADFRPPFLLLHTSEDLIEPQIQVEDLSTAQRLKTSPFRPHLLANDRDWDFLQPILKWATRMDVRPWRFSHEQAWHFYRHSFAAWNLTGWEALETTALAGKSRFTVRRNQVVFDVDRRIKQATRFSPPCLSLCLRLCLSGRQSGREGP